MIGLGLGVGIAEKLGPEAPQPAAGAILVEDGAALLAEDGDTLILEG